MSPAFLQSQRRGYEDIQLISLSTLLKGVYLIIKYLNVSLNKCSTLNYSEHLWYPATYISTSELLYLFPFRQPMNYCRAYPNVHSTLSIHCHFLSLIMINQGNLIPIQCSCLLYQYLWKRVRSSLRSPVFPLQPHYFTHLTSPLIQSQASTVVTFRFCKIAILNELTHLCTPYLYE